MRPPVVVPDREKSCLTRADGRWNPPTGAEPVSPWGYRDLRNPRGLMASMTATTCAAILKELWRAHPEGVVAAMVDDRQSHQMLQRGQSRGVFLVVRWSPTPEEQWIRWWEEAVNGHLWWSAATWRECVLEPREWHLNADYRDDYEWSLRWQRRGIGRRDYQLHFPLHLR